MEYLKRILGWWPTRILLPVSITVGLYIAILFGVALPILGKNILEEKRDSTRLLTDTAWSVVAEYHARELSGELTRADAQRRAADRVRAMRYGETGKDYFWINDMTPVMIAHPYRQDLEGVDLSNYEDSDGVKVFQMFVEAVQQSEGDYVQYLWQYQDDASRVIPKDSYIRKFAPWNWVIGTGLYLEDVEKEVTKVRQQVGAISAVGLAAVLLLSGLVVFRTIKLENRRQAAEVELEQQRDFLSKVIQSLAHPFTVVNATNHEVELANEAADHFASSPAYQTCFCVTHQVEIPGDGAGHICPLDTVKASRKPATVEHIHYDESGTPTYVEVHGFPILDEAGEVTRMIEYSLDVTARKQAEILLSEKEAQFRLLYERTPISYQSLDENGYFLSVNETWLEELGYTQEEVLGCWFGDFLPAEDRELFRERFVLFKAAGEVRDIEFKMLHKNGSQIRVAFNGKIGHDSKGHFQQTHCVFHNITEQRAAEEAHKDSERRYREISEIISDFAYSIRVLPDGTFKREWSTNPDKSLSGINFNQLLNGENLVKRGVIHPEDESRYLKRMEAFLRNEPVVTEYRMISMNGEVLWVRHYGKPVWDEDENRLVRILGAVQDITEQKRIEEALRESEDRYRTIFERSYTPMLLVDPETGQIVEANRAASIFYGYSDETLKQMNISEINILSAAEVEEERRRAFQEERNYFLFKHRLADGEIHHVEVYSAPIHLSGRELRYSIIHDVTQRVQSQEENLRLAAAIEQANELIIMTDVKGEITYVNPFFCEVTGYSREEILGQNPRILRSGLQTEAFYKQLWDTISSGKTWSGQFINRRKDGSLYHEEAIIFPVKDQRGRILNYAAVKRDVSEQIRAEQNIQRQVQRLSALRNIDAAISASLDLKLVLDILLEQTCRELGVDTADILLYNPTFQKLDLTAWKGFKTVLPAGFSIRVGRSLPGKVAVSREPIILPDLNQRPSAELFSPEIQQRERFMAYGCVPLIAKGELKGVLEVYQRTPLDVTDEWVEFLETLGGQAAIAIDNAGLFERLQTANTELILAYDTTLEGWAKALELRDQETKGHSDNVTEITLQMAQAYGISSAEMIHIRRGALLHDIGKMGIPDSILLKPGPLTAEEWEIMRKHPVYAYELLSPITFLRPALEIPYCHHEHWDGKGYPRGLRGEEIPLAARIFAIVDVWEALSSDRPYRKAWPMAKVKSYLREKAGTQFDPRLVDQFLAMFEGGKLYTG